MPSLDNEMSQAPACMNHSAQEIEQITDALLAEFQPDHWFFDHIRELEQAYFLLNKRFTRYRQNEVDTLVNQTKEELRDNTVLELDNELDQAIDFLIDQVGYYDYRQEVFQNYPEGYNSDSTEAP